jgi:phosphoribosylformylglycinamidine cyclo-ligase
MDQQEAYASAGVNYRSIQPFKAAMQALTKRTVGLPLSKKVSVYRDGTFTITEPQPFRIRQVTEVLGQKVAIADWMYKYAGEVEYYRCIAQDTMIAAINDLRGFSPVIYTDMIAAPSSEWFEDVNRQNALIEGFYERCKQDSIALVGGESPALPLQIKDHPVLAGTVLGINPHQRSIISDRNLQAGDQIIGIRSSGLHANGASLVMHSVMQLPDAFLTKLPSGKTIGQEALVPTISYAKLLEYLLDTHIDIHWAVHGTGGGLRKIAASKRPFTYRIARWIPEIPPVFLFIQELGVSLEDCLKTFNWGIGYYIFVPKHEVVCTLEHIVKTGYEPYHVGQVEEGERMVLFEPARITLYPQGE